MNAVSSLFFEIVLPAVLVVAFLGITILIHELGHYLMARRLGMIVDVFSIGFGPALWQRRRKGTLYKISWIPFGGYVALPQMEPASAERARIEQERDAAGEGPEELPPVAAWKRMLVALAGATGNVLLAVALAWIIFAKGKPSTPAECSSVVGFVAPDGVAYERGLRIGDEILAVNDVPVENWEPDVIQACAASEEVTFSVRHGDEQRQITVPTTRTELGFRVVEGIGGVTIPRVAGLMAGSGAEKAGMRVGDTVKTYDGVPVVSRQHLSLLVQERPDRTVHVQVERNGKLIRMQIRPKRYPKHDNRMLIGINWDPYAVDRTMTVHPRPGLQLRRDALSIVRLLRALVTPKQAKAAAGSVGGPVSILVMIWLQLKAGLIIAFVFLRFLNVNLAIINLLPIPVLDGGHVVFALWESLTRRPVSARVVGALVKAFAVLIISLFLLLTVRDVKRWRLIFGRAPHDEPATNAVPAEAGEK